MSKKHCSWIVLMLVMALLLPLVVEAAGIVKTLGITLVDTASFPSTQVYFSLNDADGAPITDLQTGELQLYENDVPVPAFDVTAVEHPLLIGVVIDSAISFRSREGNATRVDHAKEASRWLVAPQYGRLLPDDEVAIFAFQAGQPVRLVDFTYDHQLVLDQGIDRVSTDGNNLTALFDILRQAINETSLRAGARRRVLLVFSDGVDRTSAADVDRVIQQAQDAHLLIYTVGLGNDLAADRPASAFLRRLADETGGKYLWYQPGRQGTNELLSAMLDDLIAQRHGYMLAYTSNQYEGSPQVRLVAQRGGGKAEDAFKFEVPPLPPVVTVDTINAADILVGVVTVQPSVARSQRELDRVEYWIDGELAFVSRASPWTFEWDTRDYASSATDYDEHTLTVVACDIAQQCSQPLVLPLGTRLPLPTPTPEPQIIEVIKESDDKGNRIISLLSLIVASVALVLIIIYIRRGGGQAVGRAVQEVRRKTRVWMSQTKIFGQSGGEDHTPTLTVVSEVQKGKKFPLESRVVFLGRDSERADLVFEWDEYLSRRHVKIAQEGDQWYAWDMNSANRTWLNQTIVRASLSEGLDLQEAVLLHDGDVLKLGPELALRFTIPMMVKPASAPDATGGNGSGAVAEGMTTDTPTRVLASDFADLSRGTAQSDIENAETIVFKK